MTDTNAEIARVEKALAETKSPYLKMTIEEAKAAISKTK